MGIAQSGAWYDRFGEYLYQWATKEIRKPINTLSLFSGAGGLDIGFHDAGFAIQTMIEVESSFIKTLANNSGEGRYFGSTQPTCIDIRDFTPPEDIEIDFIIGGPPCQTFSAAGRRAAGVMGTMDKRGTLFEEYVRVLKVLKPRGFLFENVYGIVGAQNGEAWKTIVDGFEEAGYTIAHRILDTADYGVPQHRERLFIVGARSGSYRFPAPTHGPDSKSGLPHYGAGRALEGVTLAGDAPSEVRGQYGHLLTDIPPGLNYSFYTEKMGHPKPIFAWRSKFSDFLYKADPETPVRTIKALGGQYTGPFHWDSRPFDTAEFKRLQTIPDIYTIHGERMRTIHQIGNSVPPQIARILALSILNQVFNIELPIPLDYLETDAKLSFRQRKRKLTKRYFEIAHVAIENSVNNVNTFEHAVRDTEYQASLGSDFSWVVTQHGQFIINIHKSQNEWHITLRSQKSGGDVIDPYTITIDPIKKWSLPVGKVILKSYDISYQSYTAIWKAFELVLSENGYKADLVQLCNYYQYEPSFLSIIENPHHRIFSEDALWRILGYVAKNIGIRVTCSTHNLSHAWDIPEHDVYPYLVRLREIGFEVRDNGTNPTMKPGDVLIPYAFPTLTPRSVQLRKNLNGNNNNGKVEIQ